MVVGWSSKVLGAFDGRLRKVEGMDIQVEVGGGSSSSVRSYLYGDVAFFKIELEFDEF